MTPPSSSRRTTIFVLIAVATGIIASGVYLIFDTLSNAPHLIVDGIRAEVSIIHVEKRGRLVRETNISVFRNGELMILKTTSRFPQYRPDVTIEYSQAPIELMNRTNELVGSLSSLKGKSFVNDLLLRWNSDHWYVAATRGGIVELGSEKARPYLPAGEALFEKLIALPKKTNVQSVTQDFSDFCLGLCFRFTLD